MKSVCRHQRGQIRKLRSTILVLGAQEGQSVQGRTTAFHRSGNEGKEKNDSHNRWNACRKEIAAIGGFFILLGLFARTEWMIKGDFTCKLMTLDLFKPKSWAESPNNL